MRLLATLLVLGAQGFLQHASGWYPRNYYNRNVPRLVTTPERHRYGNSSYIWGQRDECESIMLTTRVAHSDHDIRQYMSAKSTTTHMRYSFIGKVTVDAILPLTKHEFECPITYIEVQNLARIGGYVCITRGGIGHRFVFLHFESNINYSMDFGIRIYGACC